MRIPASFEPDERSTVAGPSGERAHRELIEHSTRLEKRLYKVGERVHCLVGNGLANVTAIEAPQGLIIVDTGECVEEMTEALEHLRKATDAPVAAVIYSHFHYVGGTAAIPGADSLPIWGHAGIPGNRRRVGVDLAPAATSGLVHQFGILLPPEGPDAVPNVGLGRFFHDTAHAPFTPGHVEPNHTFDTATVAEIAGLEVHLLPAPSDADDSITIWIPELRTCINNLLWPSLFNVFAIRGEEYRDPRLLLRGLDQIAELAPEHLVGVHGPPLSGAPDVRTEVIEYRDSIQFLWDQTVRGLNRGLSVNELVEFVQLPERFGRSFRTRQFYGLAEHHVRQIHAGLRGWFDGDEAQLFPVSPADEAARVVEGFGGRENVLAQARQALADGDLRWAIRLGAWLRGAHPGDAEADGVVADSLRALAQRTTSSNIRNWAITRARELEGQLDLARFRVARANRGQVLANEPHVYVHALRVQLAPERAAAVNTEVRWRFDGDATSGLRVRQGVALPTDGADADIEMRLSLETWADLYAGKARLGESIDKGTVEVDGDRDTLLAFFTLFDHRSLSAG